MCGNSTFEDDYEDAVDEVMTVEAPTEVIDVVLPDNMVLKVDRVGQSYIYGDDIVPGETVRFDYDGGSESGTRTVLVVKVDNDGLEGLTLERDGGYRRYLNVNIGSRIDIVQPFIAQNPVSTGNVKRVRFDDAGTALLASLSGEKLAELYGQYVALEGVGTEFDPQTGEVVVQLPEPVKSRFVTVRGKTRDLEIQNKDGKIFALYLYKDTGKVGFYNEVTGENNSNCTPEELRDSLVKFLA